MGGNLFRGTFALIFCEFGDDNAKRHKLTVSPPFFNKIKVIPGQLRADVSPNLGLKQLQEASASPNLSDPAWHRLERDDGG